MKSSQVSVELNERNTYTTGEVISGVVTIVVHDRLDVSCIKVNFKGLAVSRNYKNKKVRMGTGNNYGRVRVDRTRKHNLIDFEAIVFPPRAVQEVTSTNSFTLTDGRYHYPFSFQIPDASYTLNCMRSNTLSHVTEFLHSEPFNYLTLPPTFFLRKSHDQYARVDYSVQGSITTPSFFKFNLSNEAPVVFQPKNSSLTYSLKHISDSRNSQLSNSTTSTLQLKFLKDESRKGSFSNWWHSNSVKIPLRISLNFNSASSNENERGPTKRVLQCGRNLSKFIGISLKPGESYPLVVTSLGQDNSEKGSRDTRVTLNYLKIALDCILTYYGATTKENKVKYILVDKQLNEHIKFTNSGNDWNKFVLNPEIFDGLIPDLCQSFVSCTIKNNYFLKVEMTMQSSNNALIKTLKFKEPVIIFSNEPSPVTPPVIQPPSSDILPPPYV